MALFIYLKSFHAQKTDASQKKIYCQILAHITHKISPSKQCSSCFHFENPQDDQISICLQEMSINVAFQYAVKSYPYRGIISAQTYGLFADFS